MQVNKDNISVVKKRRDDQKNVLMKKKLKSEYDPQLEKERKAFLKQLQLDWED